MKLEPGKIYNVNGEAATLVAIHKTGAVFEKHDGEIICLSKPLTPYIKEVKQYE